MSKTTLSFRIGDGVIEHNNRSFIPKNVNRKLIDDNIVYVQKSIQETYQEIFGSALNEYNEKQKRSDRKIENYFEHIKNSKQEKLFHEAVIQFGDKDSFGIGTDGGELAKKMLDEYMKGFQERNPHMKVFNAVMHLDEATPHIHVDFVPFATEQKRGLSTRVSLKKALEQQGVVALGKKESEWQQWAKKEKEVMSAIAKKFGLDIENKKISRPHLTVDEYKEEKIKLDEIKKQTEQLLKKTGGKKADEL